MRNRRSHNRLEKHAWSPYRATVSQSQAVRNGKMYLGNLAAEAPVFEHFGPKALMLLWIGSIGTVM